MNGNNYYDNENVTFEDGLRALENNDIYNASIIFSTLADKGDVRAQEYLNKMNSSVRTVRINAYNKHTLDRLGNDSPSIISKIVIGVVLIFIAAVIAVFIKSYMNYNKKASNNTQTSQQSTEPVSTGPAFGSVELNLQNLTATTSELVTFNDKNSDTYEGESYNGAFLFRAGNGKATAYATYNTAGLFGKLTLKAHAYVGHDCFFDSTVANIMIVDAQTGYIIEQQEVLYDSGTVTLSADITGLDSVTIAVRDSNGNLGYVLIKDAIIYPAEGEVAAKETEQAFIPLVIFKPESDSTGVERSRDWSFVVEEEKGNKLILHEMYYTALNSSPCYETYWLDGKYYALVFNAATDPRNFSTDGNCVLKVVDNTTDEELFAYPMTLGTVLENVVVNVEGHKSIRIIAEAVKPSAAIYLYDVKMYDEPYIMQE